MTKTPDEMSLENVFEPATKEQLLQAGDHLGHCRVIELIAAGGMANVYKVWHEQLEVVRAIKILKPGFSEEAKSRLETEAKISANLRHPNIVEIYGMGYWNSIPYIEMEYIDGPSLKEVLEKNGRLPIPFSLAVTHSLCVALQFAHNQDMTLYGKVYDGLIHRDIKPANILLSSRGVVKLADFGIARPSDVSLHTVGAKVMGTFAYLSPEQLNGEKLDQRSDIYAVGAVLYEMLTGSKTFPQKMLAELINRKTRGKYIPIGSISKDAPKALCLSVEKSLSLDKNKRHQEAAELDKEVVTVLRKIVKKNHEEIVRNYIKQPDPLPRYRKPLQTNAAKYIIGFVLLISFIFTGFYFFNKYSESLFVKKETPPVSIPPTSAVKDSQTVEQKAPKPVTTAQRTIPKKVPVQSLAEYTYDKAVKRYNENQFDEAISLFESINSAELDLKKQTTRIIRLMELYIKTNAVDKAITCSEKEDFNDAYFYFLQGQSYYKAHKLENAENAFKKSRTAPSQFDMRIAAQSTYYLAKIRDTFYMIKPNIDNMQLCLKAWTTYVDIYCIDESQNKECTEAKNRITTLSK
jgi:serine/threonine protein kinase